MALSFLSPLSDSELKLTDQGLIDSSRLQPVSLYCVSAGGLDYRSD
jgi:adenine deaminase